MHNNTGQPPGWYPLPASQPARITIHYGFALLAIFSLLGTVIPTIFWFVAAGNATHTTGTSQAEIDGAHAASGLMGVLGIGWLLWGGTWTLIWAAFAINHTLKARKG
jgi:hypothetical protein